LVVDAQHGRRSLLWILLQERVPECQEKTSFSQHHHLHPGPGSTQLDGCPDRCQNVAQCASPQGWSAHLVDPQQRAASGHLAPDHGNSGPLQRLRPGVPRICPTLPHGMHLGPKGLECFPQCLGRMGGAQPPLHYLALRSSWESVFEKEDDPPDLHLYHQGGFSYRRQPLDILRSFLLYYLWSERCQRHFDGQYSLKRVLLQSWEATAEVGMATWKAIRSSSQDRTQDN